MVGRACAGSRWRGGGPDDYAVAVRLRPRNPVHVTQPAHDVEKLGLAGKKRVIDTLASEQEHDLDSYDIDT